MESLDSCSRETEGLLTALLPHVERLRSIQARTIHVVLSSLQRMPNSPACNRVFEALRQHLVDENKNAFMNIFSNEKMAELFLPEVILSLRRH